MTGRPTVKLELTEDERESLAGYARRKRSNRNLAFRAQIVLHCASGMTNLEVAKKLRANKDTVGKWRRRFVDRRLAGLLDEPRVGAPRKISDEQIERIVVKTLETTPKARTHWSTRKMAKEAGVSHSTIGRIWRTFGLKPHVVRGFKLSNDPQFIEKVRDIVGLYLSPPRNAVVFSLTSQPTKHRRCIAGSFVTLDSISTSHQPTLPG